MRKKFTKALSLVLSLLLTFTVASSLTACISKGPDVTTIEFSGFNLGEGGEWFDSFVNRFETKYADKEYTPGVKGVKITHNDSAQQLSSIQTDGNAIYVAGLDDTLSYHVQKGDFLDITDILKEDLETIDGETVSILDKIPEEERDLCQVDGAYYVVPDIEYYGAITYDRDMFNKKGFYLAKNNQGSTLFKSEICKQDFYFVNASSANKTCGPDGVAGNSDDGLPSSLYELIALCEYMKKNSVTPFAISGQYRNYCNALLNALSASLQGMTAKDVFTLDSKGFDIITGWDNSNTLFPGYANIKKPIIKKIPITEETGYYTTWSADKFYAEAFVEIATAKEWWYMGDAKNSSHTDAQTDFIFSGSQASNQDVGMLVEFSYWYNEAKFTGSFDLYYEETNSSERDIAFMPMPINLDETVTVGVDKGEKPTLLAINKPYLFVNKNIENDAVLLEAVKDFLKFYYSEQELSRTTVDFGVAKRLNYKILDEHKEYFSNYCESMWDLRSTGNIVRIQGDTDTFRGNKGLFGRGFIDGSFGMEGVRSCFNKIYSGENTAKQCFEAQMLDKTAWGATYLKKVGASALDYDGLVYTK